MKTIRIALFFILGGLLTLHSFAQDVKKEKKAIIEMKVIDDNGNKKVIDTSFTIAPDQNYKDIIAKIKKQAGFSEKEVADLKEELEEHKKYFDVDVDLLMDDSNMDSMQKQMMFVRENMQSGKEELKEALEELKQELEGMKMNEEAMKKLEKAMEELKEVDWNDHAKHLNVELNKLHEYFDDDDVFITHNKKGQRNVWVDDDGVKRIIIKADIDLEGDSLELSKMHNVILKGDFDDNDQNTWVDEDGHKMMIKKFKGGGNDVFFGDEDDLKKIHEIDGDAKHRIIIKKLKGEAAKGDAIFINDDATVVKEFKDEDGNVKVMRYKIKSGDGEDNEMRVIVDADHGNHSKEFHRDMMIASATEKELGKASEKGIFDPKAKALEISNFTFDIDDENTTLGASFEKKDQLIVQIFDKNMNQLWEKNAGKVRGDWSTEISADILDQTGVYYFLFKQGKKAKLFKMISK